MSLHDSFLLLLQSLVPIMTAPSFANFRVVVTGWIFAGRHTITQMLLAAGAVGGKHFSAYHRLFAAARWSRDRMGLAVFDMIQPVLGETILAAVDDTLARKRGLKMFGTGMHHDPLLSSRGKAITNWGHSWVVLGILVDFPLWPGRTFCLPVLFRLYLNKKRAEKERRRYRSRPELAVELIELLCGHVKSRRFHVVADSAYGGQSVLKFLPANCDLTSRLTMNARLYSAPPERKSRHQRAATQTRHASAHAASHAARASAAIDAGDLRSAGGGSGLRCRSPRLCRTPKTLARGRGRGAEGRSRTGSLLLDLCKCFGGTDPHLVRAALGGRSRLP